MLSLTVSENAVELLLEIVVERSAPSIVTRPLADPAATWDIIVVWQRGLVAAPVRAFLDALAAAGHRTAVRKTA